MEQLMRERAAMGARAGLAGETARAILSVFRAMRAIGLPPCAADRERARRLLLNELNYGGEERASVVRTIFQAMRAIGLQPSDADWARARRFLRGRRAA
jgi:hypothetical protein